MRRRAAQGNILITIPHFWLSGVLWKFIRLENSVVELDAQASITTATADNSPSARNSNYGGSVEEYGGGIQERGIERSYDGQRSRSKIYFSYSDAFGSVVKKKDGQAAKLMSRDSTGTCMEAQIVVEDHGVVWLLCPFCEENEKHMFVPGCPGTFQSHCGKGEYSLGQKYNFREAKLAMEQRVVELERIRNNKRKNRAKRKLMSRDSTGTCMEVENIGGK